MPNDTDAVVAFHGTMRLGAIWVGVNRVLAPAEKAYILADAGASVLLCDSEIAAQIAGVSASLPELRAVLVADPGDHDCQWQHALAAASPIDRSAVDIDPNMPAGIAYTSGTTGRPKGVVHSHHNLLLPGAALVASRGYGAELRKGDCLALTILNMMVLTTLLVSQAGGTCVIMDRVNARGIADWVRRERITTWNGVPAMLWALASTQSSVASDLASLDEVWSGGDACPEHIRDRFQEKFGLAPVGTYGLTEAPTVVTIDDRDGPRAPGASGRALPHLEVTVRDGDGKPVPAGEVGEVCVGPRRDGPWAGAYRPMLGYLHHDEATAAALRGGVLHTGDLGSLDGEGFLTIRARQNAVIIRGGANVYPAEVERVILSVPGVRACSVFGVPDERLGQRVAALVEPDDGASVSLDEVVARCAAELARYKVPERLGVVEQLPRNAMGKVERGKLVDLLPAAEAG
jgi:acyl-CoA synthetase (AMP-forming)/AMP-acid ligase II